MQFRAGRVCVVAGFNRYMVECECFQKRAFFLAFSVLIDTWWNVNFLLHVAIASSKLVLIDTWWNVNAYMGRIASKRSSFNRYMVECEFFSASSFVTLPVMVLIDTWWNVNYKIPRTMLFACVVLIDTWWNVNTTFPHFSFLKLLF